MKKTWFEITTFKATSQLVSRISSINRISYLPAFPPLQKRKNGWHLARHGTSARRRKVASSEQALATSLVTARGNWGKTTTGNPAASMAATQKEIGVPPGKLVGGFNPFEKY